MKVFVLCAVLGALFLPTYFQTRPPAPAKAKPIATPRKNIVAAKPKAPAQKPDEGAEWTRITSLTDRAERIAGLEKFLKSFPKSTHVGEASGLLAAARVESGNDLVNGGNVDAAVAEYRLAITIVPLPVVDGFWDEGLSKIPGNLFFHGQRDAALEIAKLLEAKAGANAKQVLSLATFYLTIEDGSDAKRLAEGVIAADPTSAAAYRMLGLAGRVDFDLDSAAAAFAKAIELDPNSEGSREGLAEMKRALGKSDEALALYDEILTKEPESISARTGKVMALFEADRRTDAEAELSKTLDAAPGNVILLASAAYWYAAHGEGDKAIEYAQKAIEKDPRFIWSHIALSRGLLQKGRAADAERTLINARRYGRFPTLEYELAAARLAAGFYRDAAETLASTFQVQGDLVSTKLGGRVPRSSERFTELIADERRASIFAPAAADDPESAGRLAALLAFYQQLEAEHPDETVIAAAADKFAEGSDPMQVHRKLFAASQLIDKRVAVAKAAELAKGAVTGVDTGLTTPSSSTAVMASEIYIPRKESALRGEYLNVPEIPAGTRSAILRGRIEDIIGWAQFQANQTDDALIHLKRAVAVLPSESAWWRTSTWHLGAALAVAGKEQDALDNYIKSYKGSTADPIRYSVIDALYRKVNGSADGLKEKIGPDPSQAVAQNSATGAAPETPAPAPAPEPASSPVPVATPDYVSAIPKASPSATPMVETAAATASSRPEPSPTVVVPEKSPEPTPLVEVAPTPTPEQAAPTETPEARVSREPVPTGSPSNPSSVPADAASSPAGTKTRELFPPVVITIPPPTRPKADPAPTSLDPAAPTSPKPDEVAPCELKLSEETATLRAAGGDLAIIVGREDDADVAGITAASSSESDVRVRREEIPGVRSRALFVLRSITQKTGLFQVRFTLPCGAKILNVRVR